MEGKCSILRIAMVICRCVVIYYMVPPSVLLCTVNILVVSSPRATLYSTYWGAVSGLEIVAYCFIYALFDYIRSRIVADDVIVLLSSHIQFGNNKYIDFSPTMGVSTLYTPRIYRKYCNVNSILLDGMMNFATLSITSSKTILHHS